MKYFCYAGEMMNNVTPHIQRTGPLWSGLKDFCTPDVYFHLFYFSADGNCGHAVTANSADLFT